MLRYLLDEQIPPRVAQGLRSRNNQIVVLALAELERGQYLSASDQELLSIGAKLSLTLVTYDLKTIAPLLRSWFERGLNHNGVIFVDYRTVRPGDVGGLVAALEQLWKYNNHADWADRVVFLNRSN